MESPQKKAAAMDGIDLLPVTQLPKKTPRMDVVQRVSAWALFTAGFLAFSFGVGSALDHFQSQLTDADIGVLCCFALQAAAAVLALCLPCSRRRVRRTLAYLALALTAVGHCFCAALGCLLLVAGPGDLVFVISFAVLILVLASGDITSFLDLLLGRE